MEEKLGMRIEMDFRPITDEAATTAFIADVKRSRPDGLLLIPFKKGHWQHVVRITDEVDLPAVAGVEPRIMGVGPVPAAQKPPARSFFFPARP